MSGLDAIKELPTLQRNALCKIFNRSHFIPQEVAALGYDRLRKAEGIGKKGIVVIIEWLQTHGCELKPDLTKPVEKRLSTRARRELESAMNIVRAHGYVLLQHEDQQTDQSPKKAVSE